MPHTYDYPRPAVTVDCVIFGFDGEELRVLLIQRDAQPFAGAWALPGGFVHEDEDLDSAARRELAEETGVADVYLEQLYTYGAVDRDPRGRVITVAYYALVNLSSHQLEARTDARDAAWFEISDLPQLAFDHEGIVNDAITRLQGKVRYEPIGFELLPPVFPMRTLRRLYEVILDQELDRRNFQKRILALDVLTDTGEVERDVARRAARLYRFDEAAYRKALAEGFAFRF